MLYANTPAAKVAAGAVVATGTFANLIAPVSPFREGMPAARARADFGVYRIDPLPDPGASAIVESVAPYYDADRDAVYDRQSRSMTLEEARASKWAEIKGAFLAGVYSSTPLSVTVGAKTWPVDLRSTDDYLVISGLVQMATLRAGEDPAPTFAFTDASNAVQELTVAEVQGMGLQVGAFRDSVHAYKRRLRPIVFDPAKGLADVQAIAWEDGAPPA